MIGINNVIVMGRLGADPEFMTAKTGVPYCRFSIATSYMKKLENGEREAQTTWHKVKVFGKTAEHCQTYLKKGSAALVEGSIAKSTFKRDDGTEVTAVDIIGRQVTFIDRPKAPSVAADGETANRIPF